MNLLEWAFGKRVTPAERLRKNQRLLDKAIRGWSDPSSLMAVMWPRQFN